MPIYVQLLFCHEVTGWVIISHGVCHINKQVLWYFFAAKIAVTNVLKIWEKFSKFKTLFYDLFLATLLQSKREDVCYLAHLLRELHEQTPVEGLYLNMVDNFNHILQSVVNVGDNIAI